MKIYREENAIWDADKQRIIGQYPNSFEILSILGDKISEKIVYYICMEKNKVVGYGWIYTSDDTADTKEISIAVDCNLKGKGYGTNILEHLENCINSKQIKAIIAASNPMAVQVYNWLYKNRYKSDVPGEVKLLLGKIDFPLIKIINK